MKFELKYKILLLKKYFDTGFSVLHYVRYLILFYGVSVDGLGAVYLGIIYGITCFIVGYCWLKYGWFTVEMEIGNRFNKFVKEMREDLEKKKFK